MKELFTFGIRKPDPVFGEIDGDQRLHRERARMLHALVDSLELPVENWGYTDSASSHEYVELIVALGSAGVFTALVSIVKLWLERKKITEAVLKGPKGTMILRGGTADDIKRIARQTGFKLGEQNPRKPQTKAKRKTGKPA